MKVYEVPIFLPWCPLTGMEPGPNRAVLAQSTVHQIEHPVSAALAQGSVQSLVRKPRPCGRGAEFEPRSILLHCCPTGDHGLISALSPMSFVPTRSWEAPCLPPAPLVVLRVFASQSLLGKDSRKAGRKEAGRRLKQEAFTVLRHPHPGPPTV